MTQTPKTWEEAAEEVIASLPRLADCPCTGINEVSKEFGDERWRWVARRALATVGAYDDELLQLLVKKQSDYGHGNILSAENIGLSPIDGVRLRLQDKIARVKNLESKGLEPNNESVKDSYMDIAGYAVIILMLENGTFQLPLKRDLPKVQKEVWLRVLSENGSFSTSWTAALVPVGATPDGVDGAVWSKPHRSYWEAVAEVRPEAPARSYKKRGSITYWSSGPI